MFFLAAVSYVASIILLLALLVKFVLPHKPSSFRSLSGETGASTFSALARHLRVGMQRLSKSYADLVESLQEEERRSSEVNSGKDVNKGVGAPKCINLRDCGTLDPQLKQGCVFRSSQIVGSSELRGLDLRAVLDLRVLKKPCKKHLEEVKQQVKRTESKIKALTAQHSADSSSSADEDVSAAPHGFTSPKQWSTTCTKCDVCSKEWGQQHNVDVPIYHSDLVPWTTKLRVFSSLPAKTKIQAVGELCHLRNPEKVVASAVVDPEVMGPTVLYKLLLDHSKASMAKALRLFSRRENYPLLVHCIHGKDRTGLIIMLLLLICDIPAKLVVADYIQSELQLKAGRDSGELHELDDFLTSDNVIASKAETMVDTIAHLDVTYGSARGYAKAIGLSDEEIAHIRTNFMKQADHSDLFDRLDTVTHHHDPSRGCCSRATAVVDNQRHDWHPGKVPQNNKSGSRPTWEGARTPALEGAKTQQYKEAQPAAPEGSDNSHEDAPLSDLALEAAGEAVEDKLNSMSPSLHQKLSEGAISVDKIDPSSTAQRRETGQHPPTKEPVNIMDS